MPLLDRVDGSADLLRTTTTVVIAVIAALALHGGLRLTVRYVLRRAVRQAWRGEGRWIARLPRPNDGSTTAPRRLQRADATAHMISRFGGLFITGVTTLYVSALLGVDPLVLISSAGFVGAGLAIGGQSFIKDWLGGLLVLLEDRYAIGDRVTLQVDGGHEAVGTVEALTAAGVRLRLCDGSTWYVGHGSVHAATNHSQQLISQRIELAPEVLERIDPAVVSTALEAATHDLGLTDVVLVADVVAKTPGPPPGGATNGDHGGLTIQASRPLSARQQKLVQQKLSALADHAPPRT